MVFKCCCNSNYCTGCTGFTTKWDYYPMRKISTKKMLRKFIIESLGLVLWIVFMLYLVDIFLTGLIANGEILREEYFPRVFLAEYFKEYIQHVFDSYNKLFLGK